MFDVKIDAAKVIAYCDGAPKAITDSLVKRFRSVGAQLVGYIVREKLGGNPLERRTSTLSRAIFQKIVVNNNDVVLTIGADLKKAPYARVQEFGGDIVPKRSQNLAIPLDAARTARGVSRLSAREFMNNPGALGFDDAFVHRSKTTNSLTILGVRGDTVEPVFALKKRVTLPARSFLRSTLRDRINWIREQLADGIDVDGGAA